MEPQAPVPMDENVVEQEPHNLSQELQVKLQPFVEFANRRVDREIQEGRGKLHSKLQQAIYWLESNPRLQKDFDLSAVSFVDGKLLIDRATGGVVKLIESTEGYLALDADTPVNPAVNPKHPAVIQEIEATIARNYPESTMVWSKIGPNQSAR